MQQRPSLRRSIVIGLLGFAVVTTAAAMGFGYLVHEAAERLVWSTQLQAELDYIAQRRQADPDWTLPADDFMRLYAAAGPVALPPALMTLDAGLHDEIDIDGRQFAVMISGQGTERLALALDITELELSERQIAATLLGLSVAMLLLLTPLLLLGIGRLMRPLSELSRSITELEAGAGPQDIVVPRGASAELALIAESLRGYLRRQVQHVERERVFVDSASHELRTPIAVISGAAELLASRHDLPPAAQTAARRILATAHASEQLISLLLVLARSPEQLARNSQRIDLARLLPAIVEDHRHLLRDQQLEVLIDALPSCWVMAPEPVVKAAIGNLLRNGIENSDHGTIHISLGAEGLVRIEDPGHGMSPEQISAIYSRMARDGQRDGQGIGLDLIGRLCEHLGWRLQLAPNPAGGTCASLDLAGSLQR